MSDKTPQQKAQQKYEGKRKGKPRYSGYLTESEKEQFNQTVERGGFKSEKEMIISAVKLLHKKVSK